MSVKLPPYEPGVLTLRVAGSNPGGILDGKLRPLGGVTSSR